MWERQTNEAQVQYGAGAGGTNYYKFHEGKNKIRILAEGEIIATHFVGGKGYTCFGIKDGCPYHGEGTPKNEDGSTRKPAAKLITYVLDRNSEDQHPQQAEIPYSVVKQINTFAEEKDFAFSSFPMPYDLTVNYNKKASPNDMYKAVPGATREPVSAEVLDELEKVPPVSQIVERKKARAQKAAGVIVDLDEDE